MNIIGEREIQRRVMYRGDTIVLAPSDSVAQLELTVERIGSGHIEISMVLVPKEKDMVIPE